MSRLDITLFGSPLISIDGNPINQRVDKGVALVALLALQGPKLPRDTLSANLWTGSEASKARGALRTAIWRLKEDHLSPWVVSEHESIILQKNGDVWIDAEEFQATLEKSKQPPHNLTCTCQVCSPLLERAVALYQGDFMAGYSPRNAAGFDEWRAQMGQLLRAEYLHALARLVKGYYKLGQYEKAIQNAQRWLAGDPYNEEAHSLIIRSYAHNEQPSTAAAHYRAYKRLIAKKLDILPGAEITAIYKHILSGKNPPPTFNNDLPAPVILLLDIDQITTLRARYGILMENAVARFAHLMMKVLQQYGGRIIKQNSDGFIIYFDKGQPLTYAITLHRHFAQTMWGLPEPFSIRMVITSILKNGGNNPDYSPEIKSCQQLLRAASANQVLLTEAAVKSLELPNTSRIHNLGSFLLPGQPRSTQVFQLIHSHLPDPELHSLQKLVRSPMNFPAQSTRFVGRDAELIQITELLLNPKCRLITLVGPGGVGKTRLGIQVISQLHPTPPDGIYYIPLVAHQDPTTVYQPIADALNLSFNNLSDQATQLIDHLRARHMLLLLDNFEHLISGKSFLLELLEGAPGLEIILTSRQRLNLPCETPIDVHGLSIPVDPQDPDFEQYSGIKLFIQNARRVSPGFVLQAEDKPHVIQIIRQVGGLPLGIELSSAWIRAFTCQEIARSIAKNMDFVQSNSPDIPTRHRSLRAAFDHTWQLLSEEDRRTMRKLAIYRNGFSYQAADRLANADLTMLTSYVEKNILVRMSDNRFLMLETLRTYALENLKSNQKEYENLLDAHSEYFLYYLIERFPSFASERGASAINEVWLEIDNIRDALNRAIAHKNWALLLSAIGPLMAAYDIQGRSREGYDHTTAILKQITDQERMQQQELYYLLLGWDGNFSFRLGFSQEAEDKMKATVEFAQSKGYMVLAANFLSLLADAHRRHGDLDTALQEISQSVDILASESAFGDPLLAGFYAHALTILGVIQWRLGQHESTRQTLDRCNSVLEKSKARYIRIRYLDVLARILVNEHKYQEAINLRLEALAIAEDFNDRRSSAIMLNNMGDSVERLGDKSGSFAYIAKAYQISNEIGDQQILALTSNNLGLMSLQSNNLSEASQYYHKSLDMYRQIRNTLGTFATLRDTSRVHLLTHDPYTARSLIIEALHLGSKLGKPSYVLQLLSVIATLLFQTGRYQRARQLCAIILDNPQPDDPFICDEAQQLLAEISTRIPELAASPSSLDLKLPTFESLLAEL